MILKFMRNKILSLLALTGVLFSSCVKENLTTEGGSILVVMENDDTRTSVTDEGKFTWSEGDQVWLHTTSGSVVGTLSDGAGTANANFSFGAYFGEMTGRAVYPYNEGHSISGDVLSVVMPSSYDLGSSLTNTNAAMYGEVSDGRLKFNHMAGVMRFKFKNVPAGVNKFTITLDKKINGTFDADLTEAYPVIEAVETSVASEKTITLNFNALTETSELSLYVPLPLGTYNSLYLALYAGSQSVWTYSKSVTNTISRKSLKLMPTITLGGTIGGDIEGDIEGGVEGGESGEGSCEVIDPKPEQPDQPEPQSIDYIDEYGINHGKGVWVSEIFWAPVNCGYHATDYKYGKLYQWGRRFGQGYDESDATTPELVKGPVSLATGQSKDNADKYYYSRDNLCDWLSIPDDKLWNSGTEDNPVKTEYDPCPDGWRVPTYTELMLLSMNFSFRDKNAMGQDGLWVCGTAAYSEVGKLFFPGAGYRKNDDCTAWHRGFGIYYWSSTANNGLAEYFSEDFDPGRRANANSVRCVQE